MRCAAVNNVAIGVPSGSIIGFEVKRVPPSLSTARVKDHLARLAIYATMFDAVWLVLVETTPLLGTIVSYLDDMRIEGVGIGLVEPSETRRRIKVVRPPRGIALPDRRDLVGTEIRELIRCIVELRRLPNRRLWTTPPAESAP